MHGACFYTQTSEHLSSSHLESLGEKFTSHQIHACYAGEKYPILDQIPNLETFTPHITSSSKTRLGYLIQIYYLASAATAYRNYET